MGYDQKGAAMIALAKQGNEAAQRAAYLDYVNNFITVAGFAAYYGLTPRSAETYLAWWRDIHESHCAALAECQTLTTKEETANREKYEVTLALDPARPWFPDSV